MIDQDFIFPSLFLKMQEKGFFEKKTFLWLADMEWIPIEIIKTYEYEVGESKSIVPFAITGGGDKWVWIKNNLNRDYYVGLCENAEIDGKYYAKNTEDAILRQIIEYVASSSFFKNKNEAKSYQISEEELKEHLKKWKSCFEGIICDEYVKLIDSFIQLDLKKVKCQYGEWYALLSLEEQDELIKKYISFDMMNKTFPWFVI